MEYGGVPQRGLLLLKKNKERIRPEPGFQLKKKMICPKQVVAGFRAFELFAEKCTMLVYSGREGVQRKLELRFSNEKCIWELVSDNLVPAEKRIPAEMVAFVKFMEEIEFYFGSNTELAERFNAHSGMNLSPKGLKQAMNRCAYPLQELGVTFRSRRSNGQRLVEVQYSAGSDASD